MTQLTKVEMKKIKETVDGMMLSQIKKRLEAIKQILNSDEDNAIDNVIPLLEESKLLKERSSTLLGEIKTYLSEQNKN